MVRAGKLILFGLMLLCSVMAIVSAKYYWSAKQQNELILNPQMIDARQTHSDEVLFAHAWHLSQQNPPEDQQAALDIYNQLENRSLVNNKLELWQASQYNMGLIHLQQAKTARASQDKAQHSQFMPLLELAIHAFKTVIQANPDHYDARFSLEQALSEIPDDNPAKSGWKEQRTSVFSHVSGVSKGGP